MKGAAAAERYLSLGDETYEYLLAHRTDARDPVLETLRQETLRLGEGETSISPEQGGFLTLLAASIGAKWAVEIGTYTGASSICLARGLHPGGRLFSFDKEFKWTSIARRYWMRAGVQERIELKLGKARDLLLHFRPPAPLDLVFIDADRESYDAYYELLLPLVRPGGVILFDQMLRFGPASEAASLNLGQRVVAQLNHKLAHDPRVQVVLLPLSGGLQFCRKRPG